MAHHLWASMGNSNIICVDSYEEGVLKGRFYRPYREGEHFSSLSQFLMKMEAVLDDLHNPQSYTSLRTAAHSSAVGTASLHTDWTGGGKRATFELQILFRQHTSWQGMIRPVGEQVVYSFRSVLELIMLMDSVLRSDQIPS